MIWESAHVRYINLDKRADRREKMEAELLRVGLYAERMPGILPQKIRADRHKTHVMQRRSPGAIGCHYAQVSVMEEALAEKKNAIVLEDDLIFCTDIKKRLAIIEDFTNENDWDIIWLGATFHKQAVWHKSINRIHSHSDLKECRCDYNCDWHPIGINNIVRTIGCWSTYAYIVNIKSIEKILSLLDQNIHKSMGIDWLFILLQPHLKTYSFVPGCVKQYNNQSDIGKGITNFEGFRQSCGEYFWADKMEDFKPESLYGVII